MAASEISEAEYDEFLTLSLSALCAHSMSGAIIYTCIKPIRLVSDAILDSTRRGDLIIDPFIGRARLFSRSSVRTAAAMGSNLTPFTWTLRLSDGSGFPVNKLELRMV